MPRLSHDDLIALATKRSEARLQKNFAEADRLKKKIEEGGYMIEDAKDGSGGYSFSAIPESRFEAAEVSASVDVMTPIKRPKQK